MSPKVSVIMPVYNRETYLRESIASILNQTFQDFEFIIIDDGSTDRSLDVIQQIQQMDPRITLIALDKNIGIAHATNHGLEKAHGKYIALMDSDDMSMPSRLQQQVDYLDKHLDVGVLGSRMQVVDQQKKRLFVFDVPQQHSLIIWNMFFGRTFGNPSVMMRADLNMGGYDDKFVPSHDIDLFSRLVGHARFANLPDTLVWYRTHENSISIQKVEQKKAALHTILLRLLTQLWGDKASTETVNRFIQIRSGKPHFTRDEYQQVKAEMAHLLESMSAIGWILPDEKPLVTADMQRLITLAKPKSKSFWKRLFSQ